MTKFEDWMSTETDWVGGMSTDYEFEISRDIAVFFRRWNQCQLPFQFLELCRFFQDRMKKYANLATEGGEIGGDVRVMLDNFLNSLREYETEWTRFLEQQERRDQKTRQLVEQSWKEVLKTQSDSLQEFREANDRIWRQRHRNTL